MTTPYAKTIYATDPASAQAAVKVLAKRDGYRVRTVRSVRLVPTARVDEMPRYTVTLAVDPIPTGSITRCRCATSTRSSRRSPTSATPSAG
jgi:hypothetical protein